MEGNGNGNRNPNSNPRSFGPNKFLLCTRILAISRGILTADCN